MSQSRDTATDAYPVLLAGGVVEWSPRGRIAVTGNDRHVFLHAFCTNEIKRLQPGGVCEAFFCQANGKIIGHGFVECEEQRLVIDTVADQVEPLMRHLDRYIIREDVQLKDVSQELHFWVFLGRAGEYLREVVDLPRAAEASHDQPETAPSQPRIVLWSGVELTLRACPWDSSSNSVLLAMPRDGAAELVESLRERIRQQARNSGTEPATADLLAAKLDDAGRELWRVLKGIPLYGMDISSENLPQEVGRDASAISFNKGCYLGQEPVARIDALGHVNWELVRIGIPGGERGGAWTQGTTLKVQDKPALRLATLAPLPSLRLLVGLAYVRRELRRLARPQLSCPVSEGVLVTADGDVLLNPEILKS